MSNSIPFHISIPPFQSTESKHPICIAFQNNFRGTIFGIMKPVIQRMTLYTWFSTKIHREWLEALACDPSTSYHMSIVVKIKLLVHVESLLTLFYCIHCVCFCAFLLYLKLLENNHVLYYGCNTISIMTLPILILMQSRQSVHLLQLIAMQPYMIGNNITFTNKNENKEERGKLCLFEIFYCQYSRHSVLGNQRTE